MAIVGHFDARALVSVDGMTPDQEAKLDSILDKVTGIEESLKQVAMDADDVLKYTELAQSVINSSAETLNDVHTGTKQLLVESAENGTNIRSIKDTVETTNTP